MIRRAQQAGIASNPTVTMEWRVKRGSLPDYQHAALLLGDIVHNWRSVYGDRVLAVLDDAQPCNVPEGQIHPLGLLQVLSNQDKHRVPTVMAHIAVDLAPVVVEPEPPDGVDHTAWTGPVDDGTVLATIRFARPVGDGHEVLVRPTFAFAQQVCVPNPLTGQDEWHALGDLLNAIGPFVTRMVGYLYNAHRLDTGLPQEA